MFRNNIDQKKINNDLIIFRSMNNKEHSLNTNRNMNVEVAQSAGVALMSLNKERSKMRIVNGLFNKQEKLDQKIKNIQFNLQK